jgi:putative tryptophan/tyrosine transport system substrate-binding protein
MQPSHHTQNRMRKGRALLVGIVMLALLLSGCGAAATKVYRVGILSGIDFYANTVDGFKTRMTELGYIEGQNITYDMQKPDSDPTSVQRITDKFAADQVDLMFVFPTNAALAAKATAQKTNIPALFAIASIEGVDLVKSVREPGGNITGVRLPAPDMALKRFEIMRELAPQAKRLWVPYQRDVPIVFSQLAVLRPAAAAAGVTLVESPFANVAELQADLQARAKAGDIGMDAILMLVEPLTVTPASFTVIAKFAAEHKLPMGGALMSVGDYKSAFGVTIDNIAVGKQAALLADKILKGTPAGAIPVASPENILLINYNAAQAQGLTVPEGLLRQAAQVIR